MKGRKDEMLEGCKGKSDGERMTKKYAMQQTDHSNKPLSNDADVVMTYTHVISFSSP